MSIAESAWRIDCRETSQPGADGFILWTRKVSILILSPILANPEHLASRLDEKSSRGYIHECFLQVISVDNAMYAIETS